MKVRQLSAGFGAEVLDVDLRSELGPDLIEELVGTFLECQLLLFRNTAPTLPDRHVEIAEWFGGSADNTGGHPSGAMDNEGAAGSIRLPFHSDFTYTESPIKVISLHALELPEGGTSTSYTSGVHGWNTLPSDRQEAVRELTVQHTHSSAISDDMPRFEADHPLCLIHPRTGKPILFVTEWHADRIYGMDKTESDGTLAELLAHLYEPDMVYVHHWQLYDLVIWDNLAVQHARTDEARISEGRRLLQRVALNDVTYEDLIARAWVVQREKELQATQP